MRNGGHVSRNTAERGRRWRNICGEDRYGAATFSGGLSRAGGALASAAPTYSRCPLAAGAHAQDAMTLEIV
jgi:hypothetical protein